MRQKLAELGDGALALAIQLLGNDEDAADAVHDSFATVLMQPDAYDEHKGSLKPWFMRVVRNRCIDMLRRKRGSNVSVDEIPHPGVGPEEALRQSQRFRAIRNALASITSDKREIIILRDYTDLSYAEIAGVLGVAQGTVMSRLHRARLALKEALDRYDIE